MIYIKKVFYKGEEIKASDIEIEYEHVKAMGGSHDIGRCDLHDYSRVIKKDAESEREFDRYQDSAWGKTY